MAVASHLPHNFHESDIGLDMTHLLHRFLIQIRNQIPQHIAMWRADQARALTYTELDMAASNAEYSQP